MKRVIRPFNHTASSSFFRLACRVEFKDDELLLSDAKKAIVGLEQLKKYEESISVLKKRRTSHIKGRRKSIERIYQILFTSATSAIYFSIAVAIEKILEKHYSLKSGETYVLLSGASSKLYEAVNKKHEETVRATTVNLKKGDKL